jgi:hypothetical protein
MAPMVTLSLQPGTSTPHSCISADDVTEFVEMLKKNRVKRKERIKTLIEKEMNGK